nr:hypothetical protein [Mycoplasmopsis bovis]
MIPEEEKTKIAEYIKEVKELINNKDVEQLKKKIDELNVLHTIWLNIVSLQLLSIKSQRYIWYVDSSNNNSSNSDEETFE